MNASATLAELEEGSRNWQAGPFPKESFQFHRIVPRAASSLRGACTIDVPEGRSNVYVRVRQLNGHMAWASPVFMNYR